MSVLPSWVIFFAALTILIPATSSAQESSESCPRVSFVGDAISVTKFIENTSAEPKNMTSQARFMSYEGDCSYSGQQVEVDLILKIMAERGAAMKGESEAPYRYFVAIASSSGDIIAKEEFDTTISFSEKAPRAGTEEELTQNIPLSSGQDGSAYQILVGFQLTPDELAFNRSLKR